MNNISNKKNHFMDNPKYKAGYFNYKPIEIDRKSTRLNSSHT